MRLFIVGLLCVLLLGCSDKVNNNYYTTIDDGDVTLMTAKIEGWYCGVGDIWNNNGAGRYTSEALNQAEVVFEYLNGKTHSEFTDDSSEVSVYLPAGPYTLIVKTNYTHPDTFTNFAMPRDSVITLGTVYEWVYPDTICLEFVYDPATDSLGYYEEWRLIHNLGALSGYAIEAIPATTRRNEWSVSLSDHDVTIVSYYISHRARNRYPYLYLAIDRIRATLDSGHVDGTFPRFMSQVNLGYACAQ